MGHLQFVKVSFVTLVQLYICEYTHVNPIKEDYTILCSNLTHMHAVNTGLNPTPTTCPDLIAPTSGMIKYDMETMGARPLNTVATFTCITGYMLTGNTTRTCGSGGRWSGSPPNCMRMRKWNCVCWQLIC